MKCLSIQVQRGEIEGFNKDEFLHRVRTINRYPEIDAGDDDGPYLNFNFFTENLDTLWCDLQSALFQDKLYSPPFKRATIVVCEGEHGWDDAVFLHRADNGENAGPLN